LAMEVLVQAFVFHILIKSKKSMGSR